MPAKQDPDVHVEETVPEEEHDLNETLRKLRWFSIGLFAVAFDEIEALINRLIDRGEIAEQNSRERLREARIQQAETAAKARKVIFQPIATVMNNSPFISSADLEALDEQINRISEQIGELNKAP